MLWRLGRPTGAAALRVTVPVAAPLEAGGTPTVAARPLEIERVAVCAWGPIVRFPDDVVPGVDEALPAADDIIVGAACGTLAVEPPPPQAARVATATRNPSPTKRLRTLFSLQDPESRRSEHAVHGRF
jgi:hypothetical protein